MNWGILLGHLADCWQDGVVKAETVVFVLAIVLELHIFFASEPLWQHVEKSEQASGGCKPRDLSQVMVGLFLKSTARWRSRAWTRGAPKRSLGMRVPPWLSFGIALATLMHTQPHGRRRGRARRRVIEGD